MFAVTENGTGVWCGDAWLLSFSYSLHLKGKKICRDLLYYIIQQKLIVPIGIMSGWACQKKIIVPIGIMSGWACQRKNPPESCTAWRSNGVSKY